MKLELNIGLSTKKGPNIQAYDTERALLRLLSEFNEQTGLFIGLNYKLAVGECEQGTETCFVAELTPHTDISPEVDLASVLPNLKLRLHALASRLDQECIAVSYCNGFGELLGPRPYKGGFNPAEFVSF